MAEYDSAIVPVTDASHRCTGNGKSRGRGAKEERGRSLHGGTGSTECVGVYGLRVRFQSVPDHACYLKIQRRYYGRTTRQAGHCDKGYKCKVIVRLRINLERELW